jgi:hypothetical protein
VEQIFGNSEVVGREKGFVVIRAVKLHKADIAARAQAP